MGTREGGGNVTTPLRGPCQALHSQREPPTPRRNVAFNPIPQFPITRAILPIYYSHSLLLSIWSAFPDI